MSHRTRCIMFSLALFTLVFTSSAGAAAPLQSKPGADMSALEHAQQTNPIDINSATLTDLRSLPGVGPVIARKIVAGRPYTSIEDLKARNVLPITTYDKIRHRISTKGALDTTLGNAPNQHSSSSDKQ